MKRLTAIIMALGMVFMLYGFSLADLNDGLVAYWPFNGNADDESGNGNHGTLTPVTPEGNGPTLTEDRFGNANSAYSFDGYDDRIEIIPLKDSLIITGDITMSAWVLFENPPTSYILCTNGGPSILLGYENSKIKGYFRGGSNYAKTEAPISPAPDTYYHIVATYRSDMSKARLFIDGVFVDDGILATPPLSGPTNPWVIGARSPAVPPCDGFCNNFRGRIDDVRIYDRTLSECEIQELHTGLPSCIQIYTCSGFEAPMDVYPVTVKGGNAALPLKAQIVDENGNPVTSADISAPPVIQITFTSTSGGDPVDVTDQAFPAGLGTEGNQFVFTDEGNWQFNLKTKNYTASGTYTIEMVSGDESVYEIDPSCLTSFTRE